MKIREEKSVTQYFQTLELVDYLSNNPKYMSDDFISQWMRRNYSREYWNIDWEELGSLK